MEEPEGDNTHVFNIHEKAFTFTGLWPSSNSTFSHKIKTAFINFFLPSITVFFVFMKMFFDLNDVVQFSRAACIGTSMFLYIFKVVILSIKKRNFLTIVNYLQQPIFRSHPDLYAKYMESSITAFHSLTKFFTGLMFIAVFLICTTPMIKSVGIRYPLPFPYDFSNHFGFYVTAYAVQVVYLLTVVINYGCIESFTPGCMIFAATHFRILRKAIERCTDVSKCEESGNLNEREDQYEFDDDEKLAKLISCVKYHNAILEYVDVLEETFKEVFLTQILTCMVGIAMIGMSLMTVKLTSFDAIFLFDYFGILIAQISIYCVCGNEIILQSIRVRDACYQSKWVNCGPKIKQILIILMERTKRPAQLTAGRFVPLSLDTLNNVLRSSVSYFMVLKEMYGKQM